MHKEPIFCDHCTSCKRFLPEHLLWIKRVYLAKGERFKRSINSKTSNLLCLLKGTLSVSSNEYGDLCLSEKHILLLPFPLNMEILATDDCEILILTPSLSVDIGCNRSKTVEYLKSFPRTDYIFSGLPFGKEMDAYFSLLMAYGDLEMSCKNMQEMKQKEFFSLLNLFYNHELLANFFFPIFGETLRFICLVKDNYCQVRTATELAQKANMSQAAFYRKFKEVFGDSCKNWMLKQKAEKIKQKLLFGMDTISEISEEFKFSSLSHFNMFCKTHYGESPRELIRKAKEEKII